MRVLIALILTGINMQAAFALSQIETWQLDNGVRVLFMERHEIPVVDIRVTFSAGSARDDKLPGLASLTNGLLREGSGGLDATAVANRFEQVGAQLGNGSARDMAWLQLRSLNDPEVLDEALDAFKLVLLNPDFVPQAIERDRRQMLMGLQHKAQSPSAIATDTFYATLYKDHPYGTPKDGTLKSLQTINREDIVSFYQQYYVGKHAIVAIVGDLDIKNARALSEKVFGGLPEGRAPETIPDPEPVTEQKVVYVPFKSSQAHVRVGTVGIKRTDPRRIVVNVGNHPLGGSGLLSKISQEVREKRGLAYSIYSGFSTMAAAGPFLISGEVNAQGLTETLLVVRQLLEEYVANGPTDQELASSKQNITGSFPLYIAPNSSLVGYLSMIGFYDLPLDYLHTYTAETDAVQKDQIQNALQEVIDPSRMVIVVVGGQ